jgi:hypothetical protein
MQNIYIAEYVIMQNIYSAEYVIMQNIYNVTQRLHMVLILSGNSRMTLSAAIQLRVSGLR